MKTPLRIPDIFDFPIVTRKGFYDCTYHGPASVRKSAGAPCKVGERADESGCIPASHAASGQRVVSFDELPDYTPPELGDLSRAAWGKLSPEEAWSVGWYASGGYNDLNGAMRACPPRYECLLPETKSVVDHIEAAVAKAPPLPRPLLVYRGLSASRRYSAELLKRLEQARDSGADWTFPSLTSASTSEKFAFSAYATQSSEAQSIVFEMMTSHGLFIGGNSAHPEERELLQSAKTKFRVVSVEDAVVSDAPVHGAWPPRKEAKAVKIVHLEEVP